MYMLLKSTVKLYQVRNVYGPFGQVQDYHAPTESKRVFRNRSRVTSTAVCLPASDNVNALNCDIFDDSSHCFVSNGRHATPLTTVVRVLVTVNRQATTCEQRACGEISRSRSECCTCVHKPLSTGARAHGRR